MQPLLFLLRWLVLTYSFIHSPQSITVNATQWVASFAMSSISGWCDHASVFTLSWVVHITRVYCNISFLLNVRLFACAYNHRKVVCVLCGVFGYWVIILVTHPILNLITWSCTCFAGLLLRQFSSIL